MSRGGRGSHSWWQAHQPGTRPLRGHHEGSATRFGQRGTRNSAHLHWQPVLARAHQCWLTLWRWQTHTAAHRCQVHSLLRARRAASGGTAGPWAFAGRRRPRRSADWPEAPREPRSQATGQTFPRWHHLSPALGRLLTCGRSGGAQYLGHQVRGPLWASVAPKPCVWVERSSCVSAGPHVYAFPSSVIAGSWARLRGHTSMRSLPV